MNDEQARAELFAALTTALPTVDPVVLAQVPAAIEPLWSLLADAGLTDAFGGAECDRVVPATLFYLLGQSNPMNSNYHHYTGETL